MAKETYKTLKAYATTVRDLRLVSALTGVPMTEILDGLVGDKLREVIAEIQVKEPNFAHSQSVQNQTRPDQESVSLL